MAATSLPYRISLDGRAVPLLERAADRVDRLYAAAGRPGGGDAGEVLGILARDLDVSGAVDLAVTRGGAPARVLASVLGLV